MNRLDARRSVLVGLGATVSVVDELLVYNTNVFMPPDHIGLPGDELFVEAWQTYASEAAETGAFESLRRRLIQLRFPIRSGISSSDHYRSAVRRGEVPPDTMMDGGLCLRDTSVLRLEIYNSAAGRVPLLITSNREDFVALVQAFTRRNEPESIPDSMGACMIAGYNNWDRIRAFREAWEDEHPHDSWSHEFQQLAARKELYQDRFIILSDGPYSALPAEAVSLTDETWRRYSLIIRREHECAHYYTRRILGSMRNNVLDELIADYMGIIEVNGRFRSDWFLKFMGLDDFPRYRSGGRLENYVDGLSDEAFAVLQGLVVAAAANLERIGPRYSSSPAEAREKGRILNVLASWTLEEMAIMPGPEPNSSNSSSERLYPASPCVYR